MQKSVKTQLSHISVKSFDIGRAAEEDVEKRGLEERRESPERKGSPEVMEVEVER